MSVPCKLNYNNQTFNLVATFHKHIVYYETDLLPNKNNSTMTPKFEITSLETLKNDIHYSMLMPKKSCLSGNPTLPIGTGLRLFLRKYRFFGVAV